MIACRATSDVPRETVLFTAQLLAAERRRRGDDRADCASRGGTAFEARAPEHPSPRRGRESGPFGASYQSVGWAGSRDTSPARDVAGPHGYA